MEVGWFIGSLRRARALSFTARRRKRSRRLPSTRRETSTLLASAKSAAPLLAHHPYFRSWYFKLQEGETILLQQYRTSDLALRLVVRRFTCSLSMVLLSACGRPKTT